MEAEITTLIERKDIPKDVKITLEKIRTSYISRTKELKWGKKAEKAIRESEEKYSNLFHFSNDGIFLHDLQGNILDVNQKVLELFGYTKAEIFLLKIPDLHPPDMLEASKSAFETITKKGIVNFETDFLKKEGKRFSAEVSSSLFEISGQKVIQGIVRDITERKRADEALRASEEKYRKLFNNTNDAIFLLEVEEGIPKQIIEVNDVACRRLEYSREELLTMSPYDISDPDTLQAVLPKIRQDFLTRGHSTFEMIQITKSNSPILVEISSHLFTFKERDVALSIVRDITDRKEAEEALRESEEKYRTILESIEDSYYEVDLAGNFTFFNKNLCKILGYKEYEIMGMNYRQYCSESTSAQVFKTFNAVYRTGKPVKGLELEYIRKDGTICYAEVSVSRIVDSTGSGYGFRGIIREISERKVAEIALQEAKEKYQMLIEKMEEGVLLEDTKGYFTFVNPQAVNLLGYDEEEIVNKHWSDFVSLECLEMVKSESAKRSEGISSRYETVVLGKNKRCIPLIVSATPLFSKEGNFEGTLIVFTDITKLKKVEQKLRESERRIQQIKLEEERYHAMSSHFLNNNLQKILFALDLLLQKHNTNKELDPEITRQIKKIVHHSSRDIELINKIFAVLQSEPPRKTKKLKILNLIHNTVKKLESFSYLRSIEVNESTLSSINLEADRFLYDVFDELLLFILSSNDLDTDKLKLPVLIEASLLPSNLCISIRDNHSQPMSQLLCTQLVSPITEKWESRGHYLPIALASVIMKYYDGELKITPLDPKGNEFQLLFPLGSLVRVNRE